VKTLSISEGKKNIRQIALQQMHYNNLASMYSHDMKLKAPVALDGKPLKLDKNVQEENTKSSLQLIILVFSFDSLSKFETEEKNCRNLNCCDNQFSIVMYI
jgi:hypothetical protein